MEDERTGKQRTQKICLLLSIVVARHICQMAPCGCYILYRWFKLVCCSLRLFKAFLNITVCWFCMVCLPAIFFVCLSFICLIRVWEKTSLDKVYSTQLPSTTLATITRHGSLSSFGFLLMPQSLMAKQTYCTWGKNTNLISSCALMEITDTSVHG